MTRNIITCSAEVIRNMEYIADKDNGIKEFTAIIEKQVEALQQSLSFLERKCGVLYDVNITTLTNPVLKKVEIKECGDPINYKQLLSKYMEHVGGIHGITSLHDNDYDNELFTLNEWQALRNIHTKLETAYLKRTEDFDAEI